MDRTHPKILREIFHEHYPVLREMRRVEQEEQLAWARSIQDLKRFVLNEPWQGLFKTLGRREEFQDIQVKYADRLYRSALELYKTYGVRFKRAVALLFDMKAQNGSISALVRAQIEQDFKRLQPLEGRDTDEVARLRIVANRRAEAADPRWVEDVRARKLTIANGAGTVHGSHYTLDDQYGIRLKPVRGSRAG